LSFPARSVGLQVDR